MHFKVYFEKAVWTYVVSLLDSAVKCCWWLICAIWSLMQSHR